MSKKMLGPYTQSYMPLGDLHIQFYHGQAVHSFERNLNLKTATSHVEYKIGEVKYTREMFSSYPDQIIVIRLHTSKPGYLHFTASLGSSLMFQTTSNQDQLILRGICPEHVDPSYYNTNKPIIYGDPVTTEAITFEGRLGVKTEDGSVKVDHNGIHIMGATTVTLYLVIEPSFEVFEDGKNISVKKMANNRVSFETMAGKNYLVKRI
ncbi:hypothetical protein CJ195_09435 [Bacillus sp. UMB0899]|nr:hypothetical protein CJ195_09435 [Bacillus sp. UMB0899]